MSPIKNRSPFVFPQMTADEIATMSPGEIAFPSRIGEVRPSVVPRHRSLLEFVRSLPDQNMAKLKDPDYRPPRYGLSPQQEREAEEPPVNAFGIWNNRYNTAAALPFALASYAAGKSAGTDPAIGWRNNAVQVTNSPINFGNRAYSIGNVQGYAVGDGPERRDPYGSYSGVVLQTGKHEEGHTRQSEKFGPAYVPMAITGALACGEANPLEIAADRCAVGLSADGSDIDIDQCIAIARNRLKDYFRSKMPDMDSVRRLDRRR